MNNNLKTIIIAVIVLILILLGVSYLYSRNHKQVVQVNPTNVVNKLGTPIPVEHATSGTLVSGFPAELILDSGAAIPDSYTLSPDSKTKQYTASFLTTKSLKDAYNFYLNYLQQNKYTVVNKVNQAKFMAVYGSSATADINVAISPDTVSGKTRVVVTYLLKK